MITTYFYYDAYCIWVGFPGAGNIAWFVTLEKNFAGPLWQHLIFEKLAILCVNFLRKYALDKCLKTNYKNAVCQNNLFFKKIKFKIPIGYLEVSF